MKVYVASSWKNGRQPAVVRRLQASGHTVYDFRHPASGNDGFHWSEIDPAWQRWSTAAYLDALQHPATQAGFIVDLEGLRWCDAVVCVLPCGRSSHLELGWAVGAGKQTILLLTEDVEPELMYLMVGTLATTMDEVCEALNLFSASSPKSKSL